MPDLSDAIFKDRQGVVIAVEVAAGAKDALFPSGYNEWRRTIGCRVHAPALEGRANREVLLLIAKKLDVPASSVRILSGAASSQKRVLVSDISRQQVLDRLS